METGGSLWPHDHQLSARFSESSHLKGIMWTVIEQAMQHPPLVSASTCTGMHAYTHVCAYTHRDTHKNKMNHLKKILVAGER